MLYDINPFPPQDSDRHAIWEMLVRRDIEAYLDIDWATHVLDFAPSGFFGIDGLKTGNPDGWRPLYPSLETYSQNWIAAAELSARARYAEDLRMALYRCTTLRDIDINGDFAIAHKKFDGTIALRDGGVEILNWQTIYLCRRIDAIWRIAGFVGYLPNPMGQATPDGAAIKAPPTTQHATAGPYSAVLEIEATKFVVISGQAAVGIDGQLLANDFEGQARATLTNCATQLAAAGCSFADVFKVNCYVTDLSNWPLFNAIYQALMPTPLPVRTTVQAGLLDKFQIEIEMWAAKK